MIDSRPIKDGQAIRRRRACSKCGSGFTTYEVPEQMLFIGRDVVRSAKVPGEGEEG